MSEKKAVKKEGKQVVKTEEEFDIKEIYTPLSVAKKEIWRRWNDKALRKKVEDFLGGDLPSHQKSGNEKFWCQGIPEFLKDEPKAYFARQIISPNFKFLF